MQQIQEFAIIFIICDNLYKIAENADLLITEGTYKDGQEKWGWPHLKPEEAAIVAKKSNCKMLILTHFDASIFKTMKQRSEAKYKAQKIFQNVKIATDNLVIKI
jgi:ribonuclease BN (tRNA processing enzyme)